MLLYYRSRNLAKRLGGILMIFRVGYNLWTGLDPRTHTFLTLRKSSLYYITQRYNLRTSTLTQSARFPRGMQLSRQLYMCIAMVSQGSGQAYIFTQKTESIAWKEAYEILDNPPPVPELCVKVL